jgi:hypothetical protein
MEESSQPAYAIMDASILPHLPASLTSLLLSLPSKQTPKTAHSQACAQAHEEAQS